MSKSEHQETGKPKKHKKATMCRALGEYKHKAFSSTVTILPSDRDTQVPTDFLFSSLYLCHTVVANLRGTHMQCSFHNATHNDSVPVSSSSTLPVNDIHLVYYGFKHALHKGLKQ